MKKTLVVSLIFLLVLSLLTGCGRNKEQQVTCSVCNDTGQVKYYGIFGTFACFPKSRYNMGITKVQGGNHMTITYTQVGDYLLPNLVPPESPKVARWGMLRHSYLRNHRVLHGLVPGVFLCWVGSAVFCFSSSHWETCTKNEKV